MIEIERKFICPSLGNYLQNPSSNILKFGSVDATFKNNEKQINIYYKNFDPDKFLRLVTVASIIRITDRHKHRIYLKELEGYNISLRTRKTNDDSAFMVLKASLKDPINGTLRKEYNIPIEAEEFDYIDQRLSEAFSVDSKWDRVRANYTFEIDSKKGEISIDFNSGYGLIGEVELLTEDEKEAEEAQVIVDNLIKEAGFNPLSSERVGEWYKTYCTMWERFYRTGKTFKDFEDTQDLLND